jgi:putative flippase GtrA
MNTGPHNYSAGFVRWLKFNAVGAMGIGVQLGALVLLKSVARVNYLLATALAVEAAVLHNFLWHQGFTWADRKAANWFARLVKFNLTTGGLSIAGNLLAMKLLVGVAGLSYLPASWLSIAACSLLNFVVADRAIFLSRAPKS